MYNGLCGCYYQALIPLQGFQQYNIKSKIQKQGNRYSFRPYMKFKYNSLLCIQLNSFKRSLSIFDIFSNIFPISSFILFQHYITSPMQNIQKIKGIRDISHKYKNFFFDLDGVLWRGQESIEGSLEALRMLRKQNKRMFFVTNSSVRSRKELKERFDRFGFEVNLQQCFPSSYISALYLTTKYPEIKNIMCFGSKSLEQQLTSVGLNVKRISQFPEYSTPIDISKEHIDQTIQGIVVGWDCQMSFSKACLISFHLQNGAKFFGTNPDKFTMIGGYKVPGAGSIIASIEESLGLKAQIMGKPNTFIIDQLIEENKLDKSECLMTGDNMMTDIVFGNSAKIGTLCVLSGVSTEKNVLESKDLQKPMFYSENLGCTQQ